MSLVFSHGYYLFFGLHKEHWLAIERALTDAKNAPKEQKDSSPSVESSIHYRDLAQVRTMKGLEMNMKHPTKQPKKTKTSMNVLFRELYLD